MHEALAIAQEAAGEDPEQIKRTLLSAAVGNSDSPDGQYRLAQMLVRHGQKSAAMQLYREIAEKAPMAYQPYQATLELARSVDDLDSVRWAATALLSRAWVKNQERLYKLARSRTAELESKLRASGRVQEADKLLAAVRRADTRDLVIRVTWQGDADLDLEVLEPLGSICSSRNRLTPAGGVLVRDAYGRNVGSKSNPGEIYVCARGLTGRYEIRLLRVWGEPLADRAKVEVTYYEGTPKQKKESFYVALEGHQPLAVNLHDGRRTKLLSIPQVIRAPRTESESQLPLQRLRSMLARQNAKRFGGPRQLSQVAPGGVGAQAVVAPGVVAFQPVIVPVVNGPVLGVQAVVSADRRYVRLNVMPVFSNIIGERRFTTSAAVAGGGLIGFGF